MEWSRRKFLRGAALAAGVVAGPWSLTGRRGNAATGDAPALSFITPSEYRFINKMAKEIIPDEPVLSGRVDVAKNIDKFFAESNYQPDFLIMFRFLRLIQMADPVVPVLNRLVPATGEDIVSFKKTICSLGYYSEMNGEADLAPEQRVVWPRIGYGGPKPEGWFPPEREDRVSETLLPDRIKEAGL